MSGTQTRQKRSRSLPSGLRWLLLLTLASLTTSPAAGAAAARAFQEGRGELRQSPQTPDASPETKAFRDGREALADERWARAAERFEDFIADYPQSPNVDAAIYWLAFALQKQERFGEADEALGRLLREFPASRWAGDSQAMRIEIAPRLGKDWALAEEAGGPASDEARLVALRALFKTDPGRATRRSVEVLGPGFEASQSFKESVIMLLGRYAGEQATSILTGIARHNPEPGLRKAAIFWMGRSGDEHVLETLREFALSSDDAELALASLSALLQHGSQRAVEYIGEVAGSAKSPEIRRRANSILGTEAGGAAKTKAPWLLIKEENQLMLIAAGRFVRIVGAGELQFKQDGRVIAPPHGATLTVNGRPIFRKRNVGAGETAYVVGSTILYRDRVVRETEVVRVVGRDGAVMWELSLGPAAGSPGDSPWPLINGNFTISSTEARAFVLQPMPGGGVRLRR